jgi:hypothetical protein
MGGRLAWSRERERERERRIQGLQVLLDVGVPKHSELEPNHFLAKGDGNASEPCGLNI